MRLEGKVAVITGSASGFGRDTAVRFAEEGAAIVVVDRREEGAVRTAEMVAEAGSSAEVVVGDISTAAVAEEAAARAEASFGGLDVLINNAGIVRGRELDGWDSEEEVWDRILEVNLKGVYLGTRAAVPRMIERGGGAIVSTASIAASCHVGGAAYAAAKGGMISFTRYLAAELAPHGIRANCVSPGFMRSPMTTGERLGLSPEQQEAQLREFGARVPMGRMGTERDIADAMLYLAGPEGAYVTGQELVVDGGYLVR